MDSQRSWFPQAPKEIWVLIVEQLAEEEDFRSLYSVCRVSREFAHIALPMLYGICVNADALHELSKDLRMHRDLPYITGCLSKSSGIWASIILSAQGKTYLPYATYIRSLRLETLEDLLETFKSQPCEVIYQKLFAGFMDRGRNQNFVGHLHSAAFIGELVEMIGELVTKFIQTECERRDCKPVVQVLRGTSVPVSRGSLVRWVARLPRLETLELENAAALHGKLGEQIRKHCPRFRHLRCSEGPQSEETGRDAADFVAELTPHSLWSFLLTDDNGHGEPMLRALGAHQARSLRSLSTRLEPETIQHLDRLDPCTDLVTINIIFNEVDPSSRPHASRAAEEWIAHCKGLRRLRLVNIHSVGCILRPVLEAERMALRHLCAYDVTMGGPGFFEALGSQINLKSLILVDQEWNREPGPGPGPGDNKHDGLLAAILRMPKLRMLVLDPVQLVDDDIRQIVRKLPRLESLVWTSDSPATNATLKILAGARNLRMASCLGRSAVTYRGLNRFVDALVRNKNRHLGFRFQLLRQLKHKLRTAGAAERKLRMRFAVEISGGLFVLNDYERAKRRRLNFCFGQQYWDDDFLLELDSDSDFDSDPDDPNEEQSDGNNEDPDDDSDGSDDDNDGSDQSYFQDSDTE